MKNEFRPSDIFSDRAQDRGLPRKTALNQQAVAVYTVLTILLKMRKNLGLEAMSDFLDSYTAAVEKINPDLKNSVIEALSERAIYNLYEAVSSYEKE